MLNKSENFLIFKVHCHVYKSPLWDPILSQASQIIIALSHFFKFPLNIMLQNMPMSLSSLYVVWLKFCMYLSSLLICSTYCKYLILFIKIYSLKIKKSCCWRSKINSEDSGLIEIVDTKANAVEDNSSSPSHQIPNILWNLRGHCSKQSSPWLLPVLSQMNPVHTVPSYSLWLIDTLHSCPCPAIEVIYFIQIFLPKFYMQISSLPHKLHASPISPSLTWPSQ